MIESSCFLFPIPPPPARLDALRIYPSSRTRVAGGSVAGLELGGKDEVGTMNELFWSKPWRRLRKYQVLFSRGFLQNLQYSASHLVNAVASAVFGVIYIYLWKTVMPRTGFGDYSYNTIVHYVTFNETTMWFTQFGIRCHLRIRDSVRSGNIAQELVRPMDLFSSTVAYEYGSMVYGLIFRGIPVGLILFRAGYYIPESPGTWLWTFLALLLGCYIGIVNAYLVGMTAFWTTEIRTAYWVVSMLSMGLGGASIPIEVLPEFLYRLARWLPFPCLTFYPARIYLELSGPELLFPGAAWSGILTVVAIHATRLARKRLEVQGG